MSNEIEELKQVVAQLQKQVGRLSGIAQFYPEVNCKADLRRVDQEDVRKLQYAYGYYLDKCLYKEVKYLHT
jgi:hypothetical protein